ncbi:MAG: TldD/PmbA family protein [bacterium]|nr:TldD/PmbA family protein [bacterium]
MARDTDPWQEQRRLMRDLIHAALNQAQLAGASYADIRIVQRVVESMTLRDGDLQGIPTRTTLGFGVRVLADGSWGFAASHDLDLEEVCRVAREAVAIARAAARVQRRPVDLGTPVNVRGHYRTAVLEDPFRVPLAEKLDLLTAAEAEMRAVKGIRATEASLGYQREEKTFASTEGAFIEQELIETGCGIVATAASASEIQRRSYPNSFGRHQATRGFELVRAVDLVGNARRIAEEAVALLSAPACPTGRTTLVLDATQLALQVHESIGHAVELDRVFGMEASFAGTSFVDPAMRDHFRYGSDLVTVTADATLPGGLGTFGFDDEGVPAQRTPIIERGIFKGFLSSRETAIRLGLESSGTMRADGWNRFPLVRMTNVNLEPGDHAFERLIGEVEDGIYMQTNKSWSIDDRRMNFQFGCEIAWEIKQGKLGRMLRNPTYTGLSPEFWGGCDAIGDASQWEIWGTPNCGKGQPMQVAHVGHGAAPARFRNVQVGVLA